MIKKHPYIAASTIATVLAIVVWSLVPKEYAAVTKVSDEYKETNLTIGIDNLTAKLKQSMGSQNEGMNDIEVYCQALKTEDFARYISNVEIPGKHLTYGQWVMQGRHFWQSDDVVEHVSENIEYNISTNQQTLTVQFTDRDPLVASLMLDTTIKHLQDLVTASRHKMAEALMQNANKQRKEALAAYHKAQEKYASYSDSNFDPELETATQQEKSLQGDVDLAYQQYKKASDQYIRQIALKQRVYCSFAIIKPNVVPRSDTSHLWVYIAVFILFALAGVKGNDLYQQRKHEHSSIEFGGFFSPWSITILVWGAMGLMYIVTGDILDPLTKQFYISISLWIPILTITSFITFNLLRHDTKALPTRGIDTNRHIFYIFFFLALVLSPLFVYKVYQIVSMFDSKDMMKNVRELAVYGDGQGFLNYAIVISQSVMLVSFWKYPKMPLWQLMTIILCCVISSLAIMEKGGIFLAILCGIYVLFERNVISLRSIAIVGCVTVFGFYLFNLARAGEESDYSKNESLLDFIGMYIMSPPVAYCRVRHEISTQFGPNTFETIYLFLKRFGVNVEVHDKLQEFVFVPISTNVYTIMQPFFRDFGYLGVAFFAWLYGIVSGLLYRLSSNGNNLGIVLYTYMVYVLVLQFYQENIFLSMVGVLQLCFFVALFTLKTIRLTIIRKGGQDET